jgi:hypothetical protein
VARARCRDHRGRYENRPPQARPFLPGPR